MIDFIWMMLFSQNLLLGQFLGVCPSLRMSLKHAFSYGLAVTAMLAVTSVTNWLFYYFVLLPLGATYLFIFSFAITIPLTVTLVSYLQKYHPLFIHAPLLKSNCVLFGFSFFMIAEQFTLLQSLLAAFTGGLGYILALVLIGLTNEKLSFTIPSLFRGLPILFILLSILSALFTGVFS